MDSKVAGRIVQVLIVRFIVTVAVVAGSIYLYQHPDALNQAGRGFAERYMPPMATLPEVNATPTPVFRR